MAQKPRIVVAGILDTKGKEIKFIADQVRAGGGEPVVLELSVGKEAGWADIPVSVVVAELGKTTADIFSVERAAAAKVIVEGATRIVGRMKKKGELDGMIAMGGSMGTSIACSVMRALPIGFPKVMLSTMTSGDIRPYVGTRDIAMIYPIAEVGLNVVTRTILKNAAGAVVGMALAPEPPKAEQKPLIGCMMFGVTTPAVLEASRLMEEKGYDVMINHAVGSGGKSMEELIADGYIVGMLDITTHEIGDLLLGGVLSAGPDRLTAAGARGIPQVVAPGGLDVINFGAPETVPEQFRKDPRRLVHEHNPTVTIVNVLPEEAYDIAKHIAEKLNRAKGPTALCIPMRGWGAYDNAGGNPDLGWAENTPAPCWVPDPEKPEWSHRSVMFVKGIREKIDRDKKNLDVLLVDRNMNEKEHAALMAGILYDMLQGSWRKGAYHTRDDVLEL
jgi:uncharacterized protein (UPF0261 family)